MLWSIDQFLSQVNPHRDQFMVAPDRYASVGGFLCGAAWMDPNPMQGFAEYCWAHEGRKPVSWEAAALSLEEFPRATAVLLDTGGGDASLNERATSALCAHLKTFSQLSPQELSTYRTKTFALQPKSLDTYLDTVNRRRGMWMGSSDCYLGVAGFLLGAIWVQPSLLEGFAEFAMGSSDADPVHWPAKLLHNNFTNAEKNDLLKHGASKELNLQAIALLTELLNDVRSIR